MAVAKETVAVAAATAAMTAVAAAAAAMTTAAATMTVSMMRARGQVRDDNVDDLTVAVGDYKTNITINNKGGGGVGRREDKGC